MSSIDILLTLVFSIVMLLFMSFPALKVADFVHEKFGIKEKWNPHLVITFTVVFSILIGLFLRFA